MCPQWIAKQPRSFSSQMRNGVNFLVILFPLCLPLHCGTKIVHQITWLISCEAYSPHVGCKWKMSLIYKCNSLKTVSEEVHLNFRKCKATLISLCTHSFHESISYWSMRVNFLQKSNSCIIIQLIMMFIWCLERTWWIWIINIKLIADP